MNPAERKLDIVLPCYNPAPGWAGKVIHACSRLAEMLPREAFRIILVNDGSVREPGKEELARLDTHIRHFTYRSYEKNMGKGYALRKGVGLSDAPYCIYTDVDFPYKEDDLLAIYNTLLKDEADIVAGIKDNAYYHKVPPVRRRISRFLRFLIKKFLRMNIDDTQCGLKGFNQKGREIFLKTTINRYLFDLEFLYLASRTTGIRLAIHPSGLKDNVQFTSMNWSILLQEGFNFVRIFFKRYKGKPS